MRGGFARVRGARSTGCVADVPLEGPQKPDFFIFVYCTLLSRLQALNGNLWSPAEVTMSARYLFHSCFSLLLLRAWVKCLFTEAL